MKLYIAGSRMWRFGFWIQENDFNTYFLILAVGPLRTSIPVKKL